MKPLTFVAALILAATGLAAQAAPAPQAGIVKGEVLETRDVASYTYLRLKTAEGEIWAAVPTSAVKKGAQVTIGNATTMENFESKTLNKKFDKIVFGQLVDPNAKPGAAQPAMTSGAAATQGPVAAPGPVAVPAPVVKVAKATGPDAKTVAEVVKGKSALKDKTVLVRGQVVKVNLGILGKNWLHLQDGSGTAAEGTNDILVTSKGAAAIGDVVTARGKVRTDVNVGSGYNYAVLIEDATVGK